MPEAAALAIEDGTVARTASRSRPAPARSPPPSWGPGLGKTHAATISGLVLPAVAGADPRRRRQPRPPSSRGRGAGVAHVPEGQGVITELTVEENLRLGALARGAGAAVGRAQRRLLADPAGRTEMPGRSGVSRRSWAIAGALMSAPRVLLLDEPSLGRPAHGRAGHGPGDAAGRAGGHLPFCWSSRTPAARSPSPTAGWRSTSARSSRWTPCGRRRGPRRHYLGFRKAGHAGVPGVHPRRDRGRTTLRRDRAVPGAAGAPGS